MFVSKRNNIVFPQSEHVKLATILAQHWGNDLFEKPPVPHESFIKAVSSHDNGYGHYDISAVGQQTEDAIERLWRRCTDQNLNDIYAELIIKRHFMRLTSIYPVFPKLVALHQELEEEIETLYKSHELDPHIFDVTDTVMNACDAVSFSFCQEETASRTLEVYAALAEDSRITMTYSIDDNHSVTIDPYPLDEAIITGHLIGYDKSDYPNILLPNEINYQIIKKP